jgi:glutathione S-transferase
LILARDSVIIIYSGPLSLFSRKVEIALTEKAITFERVIVTFSQTSGYHPKDPVVLKLNPKGQVPVLIHDEVLAYDSTVILEYLEDAFPTPALYPANPASRAECRMLELYADEVMLVPLRALMHRTSPRPDDPDIWEKSERGAKQAEKLLADQFAFLNERLRDQPFFCGAFSVADIALFMAFLFSQRLAGPPIAPHRNLARWWRTQRDRTTFAKVLTEVRRADDLLSSPVFGAYADCSPADIH